MKCGQNGYNGMRAINLTKLAKNRRSFIKYIRQESIGFVELINRDVLFLLLE